LPKPLRESPTDILEECAERRQSLVTRLSRVTSALFEEVQKLRYEVGVEIVESKLSNLFPRNLRSKLQKQAHRVGIARYRVRPQSSLKLQMVVEK
jgi:hypothetical protein